MQTAYVRRPRVSAPTKTSVDTIDDLAFSEVLFDNTRAVLDCLNGILGQFDMMEMSCDGQHIGELWKGLLGALVPALEDKVERDRPGGDATRRLRLGLYTFDEDTAPAAPPPRKTRKQ